MTVDVRFGVADVDLVNIEFGLVIVAPLPLTAHVHDVISVVLVESTFAFDDRNPKVAQFRDVRRVPSLGNT